MTYALLTLIVSAMAFGCLANADTGGKEGTGDSGVVSKCKSLPNTDSVLSALGTISHGASGIRLELRVGPRVEAVDRGVLSTDGRLFQGQIFDIQLGTPSRITAKASSRVMNCEFTGSNEPQ